MTGLGTLYVSQAPFAHSKLSEFAVATRQCDRCDERRRKKPGQYRARSAPLRSDRPTGGLRNGPFGPGQQIIIQASRMPGAATRRGILALTASAWGVIFVAFDSMSIGTHLADLVEYPP